MVHPALFDVHGMAEEIRTFIKENDPKLKAKPE